MDEVKETKELPTGCFNFINHKRILCKDINNDRPYDQYNVSTERAIAHRYVVKERPKLLFFRKKPYWAVFSTTTYEMSGSFYSRSMGGRAWAETDMTGLEWHFNNKIDALDFAIK